MSKIYRVHSAVLGEQIVFADNEALLPEQYQNLVVYRMRELEGLVKQPPSPTEMCVMHQAKKVFGGELELAENIPLFK